MYLILMRSCFASFAMFCCFCLALRDQSRGKSEEPMAWSGELCRRAGEVAGWASLQAIALPPLPMRTCRGLKAPGLEKLAPPAQR